MYTLLFDEAEARGIAIGEARGKAIGEARGEARGEIKGVIKLYHEEMNLMPSEIIKKIRARFGLRKDVAEKYVEEVLGMQTA